MSLILFDEVSLLDPSCSGSGIINRLDHLVESGAFSDTSLGPSGVTRIANLASISSARDGRFQRCAHRAPDEACDVPAPNAASCHEMYATFSFLKYLVTLAPQFRALKRLFTQHVVYTPRRTNRLLPQHYEVWRRPLVGSDWPRALWYFLSGRDGDNQGSWMTQVVAMVPLVPRLGD